MIKEQIEKTLNDFSGRIDSLNYPYVINDMTNQILNVIQQETDKSRKKLLCAFTGLCLTNDVSEESEERFISKIKTILTGVK